MTQKKKVLIDLRNLKEPNCGFGQIAKNYAALFRQVQLSNKEQFDICFLLPRHIRTSVDLTGVECYREQRFWWEKLFGGRLPRVDVWHSVNQHCRCYPKDKNTKLIFTIHDYNFLFEEKPKRVKYFLKLMQKRIDKACAVTFISHFTEHQVRENSNLNGKLTRTIYNGIEELTNKPMSKPGFVNHSRQFFFAIGQFLPKKKFDVLIDVMKHFPEYDLYICGDNKFKYGQEIVKRIKGDQIKNVFLPGVISNEERVWLFANCYAYLFPSIGEGFGLPAIEAMQFGKPVFASKHQSLPEIVNTHGYIWDNLVPDQMAQLIKSKLKEYYGDKDKIKSVKDYANSFSYKNHIEAYLQLYRELLGIKL